MAARQMVMIIIRLFEITTVLCNSVSNQYPVLLTLNVFEHF